MVTDNLYLDLAINLAVKEYHLDENEWTVMSLNDGAKTVTVGLEHNLMGSKIRATFPREIIRYEEMKSWSEEKKVLFLKQSKEDGVELPEVLHESFQDAMIKLATHGEEITVTLNDAVLVPVDEEESAEEFERKVEGKKKFKRKAV